MYSQDMTFQDRIILDEIDPQNPRRNLYFRATSDLEVDPQQVISQLRSNHSLKLRNLMATGIHENPESHLGIDIRPSYNPLFNGFHVARLHTVTLNGGNQLWSSQTLPEVLLARSSEEASPEFERTYQPLFLYYQHVSQISCGENIRTMEPEIKFVELGTKGHMKASVRFSPGKEYGDVKDYFARRILRGRKVGDVPKDPVDIARGLSLEEIIKRLAGFQIALKVIRNHSEKTDPQLESSIYGVSNLIYMLLEGRKEDTTNVRYPGRIVTRPSNVRVLQTNGRIEERVFNNAITPLYNPHKRELALDLSVDVNLPFSIDRFADGDYGIEEIEINMRNYLGIESKDNQKRIAEKLSKMDKRIIQRLFPTEEDLNAPSIGGLSISLSQDITYNILNVFLDNSTNWGYLEQCDFLDLMERGLNRISVQGDSTRISHFTLFKILGEVANKLNTIQTGERIKLLRSMNIALNASKWVDVCNNVLRGL